jgi:integrase
VSLWRRPSGIYESHLMVDGVRYRKSTGTSNRRLAQAIDRKHEEELVAKRFQVEEHQYAPDMKFGELVAKFIAEKLAKPWHMERLKLVLPYFANFEIVRINRNAIRQYRAFRHSKRKLTETTINRDIEALRHILFWAVDEGYLPSNPLARLKLERPRRKKRPVMSLEDEQRLLSYAAPHLQHIIICALDTGMRRGEIVSQLWQDIDFPRCVLSVTRSKTAGGESREIPLTKRLFSLLSKEPQTQGHIFTFAGRPVHRIKTAWKAAVRRAGIKPYRFKDLRATFNSRLIEAGVIKDVRKELMGHSRNEDTNDLYSHIELPLLREAIARLESWRERQIQTLGKEADGETLRTATDPGDAGDNAERTKPVGSPDSRPSQSDPAKQVSASTQAV